MVRITILVPLLSGITDSNQISSKGCTLREIIDNIDGIYPGFKETALDRDGILKNFMQVYAERTDAKDMIVINDIDERLDKVVGLKFMPISCGG